MDNNNRNDSSKQVLLSVLGVAILIVAVVGISFAAFTYSKAGTHENTVSTGAITMNYNEASNGINITNAMPMTEEQATSGTAVNNSGVNPSNENTSVNDNVFDFTVNATITGTTSINYEVIAVESNGAENNNCSTASSEYGNCKYVPAENIRLRLDESSNQGSSYTAGEAVTMNPTNLGNNPSTGRTSTSDAMILTSGTFNGTATKYYRLWMWVDSAYVIDGVARSYTVKVNVNGAVPPASTSE